MARLLLSIFLPQLLSQLEAWGIHDVTATLQTLFGLICYRRSAIIIRQACQGILEIPLVVSVKDLQTVVSSFEKFQEVLAHRFCQVTTYRSQMELMSVALNLGNKLNLLTEERQLKLDPETIAESNRLFQNISLDNDMKVSLV